MSLVARKYTEIMGTKSGTSYGMQEVTVKTLLTGELETYKVLNGIYYNFETPDSLIRVLDDAYRAGTRCRFFLGDQETGYDMGEENLTIGTIGCSMGEVKIPLLLANRLSSGGSCLLDQCIVKVVSTKSRKVLWQHQSYKKPEFEIIQRGETGFPDSLPEKYTTAVIRINHSDGRRNYANFCNAQQAVGYVKFMTGERNSKAYKFKIF
ncbi:hypothetical protein [Paenibacillus polymyxa]|uniref:hypothetical protein n=1 Tax=Paenibacillus polymyxa TaxID=1406 RepID=UPI0001E6BFBD|nr:hypothetical protein [Paenibacillus polymyxa]WPQ59832.1 hypothetical protein SKN87_26445 [Paenibacillus polymyxa]